MALKSTGSIDVLASDDIYLNASHLGDIRMRGRGYSFLSVGGSADTFSFGKERTQISNDFIIKLDDTVN
ncbi:hypothetical protein, partial [Bacillus wiedmannii]